MEVEVSQGGNHVGHDVCSRSLDRDDFLKQRVQAVRDFCQTVKDPITSSSSLTTGDLIGGSQLLPPHPLSYSQQSLVREQEQSHASCRERKRAKPLQTIAVISEEERNTMQKNLNKIQAFINSFEYNYTGLMFFSLKKTGGTGHVLKIYNQIITYKLPIQCVEAVFIGSAMTDKYGDLQRFPLCFKSRFRSSTYRHIVLMVHYKGKWGALGISRRSCLMDKALIFSSAEELIENFRLAYESVYHRLLTAYCGCAMPHHMEIDQTIVWKALKLRLNPVLDDAGRRELQNFLASQIA
eukprot:gene5601-6166_t